MNRGGFGIKGSAGDRWKATQGQAGRRRAPGSQPSCQPCGRGTRPDNACLRARQALAGCSGPLKAGPAFAHLCGSQSSQIPGAPPAGERAWLARLARSGGQAGGRPAGGALQGWSRVFLQVDKVQGPCAASQGTKGLTVAHWGAGCAGNSEPLTPPGPSSPPGLSLASQ